MTIARLIAIGFILYIAYIASCLSNIPSTRAPRLMIYNIPESKVDPGSIDGTLGRYTMCALLLEEALHGDDFPIYKFYRN